MTREVTAAFAGYIILSTVRLMHLTVTDPRLHDFFRSGAFESAVFICYSIFFVMLTHSLSLAVNRRLTAEITAETEKFARAFHSAPFGMIIKRISDGMILDANEEYRKTTGYSSSELTGKTMPEMRIWENSSDRQAMIEKLVIDGKIHGTEAALRTKDGERITALYSAEIISIGGEEAILSTIHDITERKIMEEKIRDISTRDPLTGVYNRRHILERLAVIMAEHERLDRDFALAMIDLDRFKAVNDTWGHLAGDSILIDFAKTVSANIRPYDLFGRYGGEEFLVVFSDTDKPRAADVMERILHLVRDRTVPFNGGTLSCTFSCGITGRSECGNKAPAAETMIETADRRLYAAKNGGRNMVVSEG